jgi:hypothetical protein
MSSYFDEASLVMIPSGYKNQKVYSVKPLDGSGDLTFSRASSATRVASDGLIEKVRTNVVLYSQAGTNAAWFKDAGVTATDGQQDANGGTNGIRIQYSGSSLEFRQAIAGLAGVYTMSVYIKGTSGQTINLYDGVTNSLKTMDGTWQRFTVTSTQAGATSYSINTYGATATDILISFPQLETGDIATDYIATTTAAVSVGPVSGLPRLDYLNSTCPRLLLEPQRTNSLTYSEQFDNAAWSKIEATITSNTTATLDPTGYYGADKLVESSTNDQHVVFQSSTGTSATYSFFAKAAGRDWVAVLSDNGSHSFFNIANGTLGTIQSGSTATITSYGNGWYRCTLYNSHPSFGATIYLASANGTHIYQGNGTSGAYIFGAQLEASSAYATSYIPTLGTSVTRVADAASKTGISSLIGQTAGALFVEVDFKYSTTGDTRIWSIWDAGSSEVISLWARGNALRYQFYAAGGSVNIENDITATEGVHKLALSYNGTNLKVYMDGVVVIDTTMGATANLNCSVVGFAGFWSTSDIKHKIGVKQALLFKTALTNAQLAELTA